MKRPYPFGTKKPRKATIGFLARFCVSEILYCLKFHLPGIYLAVGCGEADDVNAGGET